MAQVQESNRFVVAFLAAKQSNNSDTMQQVLQSMEQSNEQAEQNLANAARHTILAQHQPSPTERVSRTLPRVMKNDGTWSCMVKGNSNYVSKYHTWSYMQQLLVDCTLQFQEQARSTFEQMKNSLNSDGIALQFMQFLQANSLFIQSANLSVVEQQDFQVLVSTNCFSHI